MPSVNTSKIPEPTDWQEFQRMMCDLYKRIWEDSQASEFGRSGQSQFGVDIIGVRKSTCEREAVQCKVTSKLRGDVIVREYEKAKTLPIKIKRLIIASTAPRDAKAQEIACNLSDNGPFRCDLMFWDDIKNELANHMDIFRSYYKYIVFQSSNDLFCKIVYVDIKETHYEILISKTPACDDHYGQMLLIADLLHRKCQTYRIGDHWSRLDGFMGYGKYDAFVVSKWLNSFGTSENLFSDSSTQYNFTISTKSENDFFRSLVD